MTVIAPAFEPTREFPNREYYFSSTGLYDFQVEGIAECIVRTAGPDGLLAIWDTGIGKSHLAMATAGYLFADDQIDFVMVIAEKNKLKEWQEDFDRFTAIRSHLYHGTGRQKRWEKALRLAPPYAFITTYETGRNELMTYEATGSRGRGRMVDGPLVADLGMRDKRIFWVFDEPIKVRKRGSENHRAYDYILRSLRRGPHHQRVLGLTATPMERDLEDFYNIGRIIAPNRMPTVERFEELCVLDRDQRGRPRFRPGRQQVFGQMYCQPIIIRKRKTDPDVLSQFPKQVEESVRVTLTAEHARLYEAVETMCDVPEDQDDRTRAQVEAQEQQLFTVLRMVAGHPAAVLHSDGAMAQAIVEEVGADRLREIRSSKVEGLLDKLQVLVRGQGAQIVIFTFFANTVLPELERELVEAGYLVSVYKGGRSNTYNERAKQEFKNGETEILLASDAAARGMNLENAQYVIEYESASTYGNRNQRLNRAHRISSSLPSVTCLTMILENTIEEGIIELMLSRNGTQDTLLGDVEDGSAFVSATERRRLLNAYRHRRRKS